MIGQNIAQQIDEFRLAAMNGNLSEVNRLLEIEEVRNQAAALGNFALKMAASRGHLDVVNRLLEIEEVRNQAAALDNSALRRAAENGHLNVVNRLLEIEAVRNQAAADDNNALREAALHGHLNVVNRLLEIEAVRNQAAVDNNIALRWAAALGHLNVVNRLLEIPAVLENATANHNDALRGAIHSERHAVAARLRQIPAVAAHEAAHPILPPEEDADAAYGLAAIAADAEGAIAAPPVETRDNFAALKKRYEAQFKVRGREAILEDLRKYLTAEYLKNPAQYQGKALPLDYDKSLAKETHAFYYTHLYHTAWRYLFCRPNPWVAPEAGWVTRTAEGAHASISEDAWNTIAILWLAASDTSEKRPEGIQDRFVEILCDAARGHNFDKYKTKDDEEGDKPSCSLGIGGRVLQFLQLLEPQNQPLTPNILCDKFKALILAENQGKGLFDKINALNLTQLKSLKVAMKKVAALEELTPQEQQCLKEMFTFDPTVQKAFFAQCNEAHGEIFCYKQARSFDFQGEKFESYSALAQHLFNKVLEVFYKTLKEKIEQRLKTLAPKAKKIKNLRNEPVSSRTRNRPVSAHTRSKIKSKRKPDFFEGHQIKKHKLKEFTPLKNTKKAKKLETGEPIPTLSWSVLQAMVKEVESYQKQLLRSEQWTDEASIAGFAQIKAYLENPENANQYEGLRTILMDDGQSGGLGVAAGVKSFKELSVDRLYNDLFKLISENLHQAKKEISNKKR